MVNIGGLFGEGSVAQQMFVYGVLQNVVQAAIQPGLIEITKLVLSEFPVAPLQAPDAANAVARGLMSPGDGADAASQTGYGQDVFTTMTELAQHAPALGLVLAAYHRNLIGEGSDDGNQVSLKGALIDSGIPDRWHDIVLQASVQIPSGAEVLNAWLEGQISADEAARRWKEAGMDPTWLQSAYDSNGEAPTPMQALELLNRGIIPENGTGPDATSYEQAFLEGPWRNKWLPAFKALAEYLPPPRTVTAMYHGGQIDQQTATSLLIKQGLTPQLAAAYLAPSQSTKTTTARELTAANVIDLYKDQLLSATEAVNHLTALRYSAADAKSLIALADFQVTQRQYSAAVTRTKTLFLAGELTAAQAQDTLTQVGVNKDQIQQVIATWRLEQARVTRELTGAQIESAWYYMIMDTQTALSRLTQLGYSQLDAWIALSVRNKGPLSDVPAPGGYRPPPPPKPLPLPGK